MTELRKLAITEPDADGHYRIRWTSEFTVGNAPVTFGRTSLAHEEVGKNYGGYAGLSLRLPLQANTPPFPLKLHRHARLPPARRGNHWHVPVGLAAVRAGKDVYMEFAGGIKTHFMCHDIAKPIVETYRKNWTGDGTTFFGPKGWVSLSREGYAASNPEWFLEIQGEGAKRVLYKNSYYQAFIDSVLAIKSGSEIARDQKAYRIVSPEPLNERMSHPVRCAWKQG
jgi:hypothetical protein